MDRRITIGLFVVLVLLGGYIWYVFGRADAPPLQPMTPTATTIAILQYDDSQVTAFRVRAVAENKITRVVRADTGWEIEQPAQGLAYAYPIDTLLYDLSRLNAERKIETPQAWADYGLNPPQYEIEINLQDGSTRAFQLGNQNPDASSFYVRKAGDGAVYLIGSNLGEKIQNFVMMPPYPPTPEPTEVAAPTP